MEDADAAGPDAPAVPGVRVALVRSEARANTVSPGRRVEKTGLSDGIEGLMRDSSPPGVVVGLAAAVLTSGLLVAQGGPSGVTSQDLLDGYKNPSRWLDVLRRLQRPAAQPAEADHAGQRRTSRRAVDVPDRDHAAAAASRATPLVIDGVALRHRHVQLRVGARRAHRPAVLALPARAADRPDLRRDLAGRTAASACSATGCSW